MLNIRKLIDIVCDDNINIILDYIDSPHDILKLIYYNKYHLYLANDNNNNTGVKETTNSTQLLLYKRFFGKVMKNMEKFAKEHGAVWSQLIKALNRNSVISGGSLLGAIYGIVNNGMNISLDYYYDEFVDIYKNVCDGNMLDKFVAGHLIKNYYDEDEGDGKINTGDYILKTDVDIDIFTIAEKEYFDIYNITQFVEWYGYQMIHMDNGKYIIILYIQPKHSDVHGENIIKNIMNGVTEEYGYDAIEDWDEYDWNNDNTNSGIPNIIKNSDDVDLYVNFGPYRSGKLIFKITIDDNFRKINITSKNVLHYMANNMDKIEKYNKSIPEFDKCVKAIEGGNVRNFECMLQQSNNTLLRNLRENGRLHEKTKYRTLYSGVNIVDNYDDPKRYPYKKYNEFSRLDFGECTEPYKFMFNKNGKKQIMPTIYRYGNNLKLNIIYINQDQHKCPNNFVHEDFDIDVCKQIFDGEKIFLHSIGNLVRKSFQYNINEIKNNLIDGREFSKKYMHFRKRIEKYKNKGFKMLDEENIVNEVKKILNINNGNKNIYRYRKRYNL